MKVKTQDFTEGRILLPLIRFALPVLLTLFLQFFYGAVDLWVVGKYASTADVSGVSTGMQFMHVVLSLLGGFAMSTTVLLGQKTGEKDYNGVRAVLSTAIFFFTVSGLIITAIIVCFADALTGMMNAPAEAYSATFDYIRICGAGSIFIFAYNLLGSIFRGLGDSRTPLLTVSIACVFNIAGDIFAVAVLKMGAAGAAYATVAAQLLSVVLSIIIIRRRGLELGDDGFSIRPDKYYMRRIIKIGVPVSIQDILVSISFAVLVIIVNSLGLVASAAIGVGEKLCSFIMLIPSACSQAVSVFVAQNVGAGRHDRARKGLIYMISCAFAVSLVLSWLSFFHGDFLSSLFTSEVEVISASASYLKAYAIDCLLTSFMFSLVGYFSGYAKSTFVMIQGIVGAFFIRIPVAYIMSLTPGVTLFRIGLSTPCSTLVQIIMCLVYMRVLNRRKNDLGVST